MKRFFYVVILFVFLMYACSPKRLSKEELSAYVLDPENGLRQTIAKNDITLEVLFRPKDLIIAQETGVNDPVKWKEMTAELDSMDYFILHFSRNGKEIENTYARTEMYPKVINYLSGAITADIILRNNKDTIPPENVVFVPTFGSSNVTSLMLVFKSSLKTRTGDISVIFDDKVFGTGVNEFHFESKILNRAPGLILPR